MLVGKNMKAVVSIWLAGIITNSACSTPTVSGSGLLLNMQPSAPSFSSTYDFDLLEAVTGHACVERNGAGEGATFWVSLPGFTPTNDRATNEAVGAAAFRATNSLDEADTILLTRLVTSTDGGNTCATVFGRGVKIRKAGVAVAESQASAAPAPENRMAIPSLDRDLITTTIQSIMGEIRQCAIFEHGAVKLSVAVAATGIVSAVTVLTAPKGELGACVANEVKKAVFPPSRSGATFTYPLDL